MKAIIAGSRTLEPSSRSVVILENAIAYAALKKGIVITEKESSSPK